jgi:transposase-like protein
MTKREGKAEVVDLKGLLERDGDFVRAAVEALVQAALEAEMTQAIGAAKGERSETRIAYRSGYYTRSLITRVGTLELRVPQDRLGRFSTELFERYQRSEKALVGTLAEMSVQGVSTRKSLPQRRLGSRRSPRHCAGTASRRRRCYVHFLRNALDHVPRKSLPLRRRGLMTTACRSCAGSTTGAISPRGDATSPNGSPSGRANIPGCAIGSRKMSRRR